jgi:acyl-coenzyme A synthetase/AMP-(fatty) acid ligase
LPGRPTPEAVLETIRRYEPTLFFCVPTLYRSILGYEGAGNYDLSSIRLCVSASEPLPADIWQRWEETFGLTILDGIGTTEMLHIFVSNFPGEVKPGSSGKTVPGYEARILDEEGRELEAGDAGQLQVKGDSALAYYWRNHEETKEVIKGEWLDAGDWYRLDEDGFYWYEGRSDDMIKVSGLWVSPLDVENTLNKHEAVSEAAAVGIPVDGLNQVKAFVVLEEGHEGSENLAEEIREWSKDKLKGYEQPQLVAFVEELPKNPMGKLQRKKLREAELGS